MQARSVSPELRQKIESLYQSARELEPQERPSFLDRVCAGDLLLRHEVESLLSAHDENVTLASAPDNPTKILPEKSGIRIGQSIAHYKVVSLLGRGGMGEVYLAHDTRLGRNVALKILPKALNADEDRLRRFARESRSASALNHPNVSVIHEIGETEDGGHFIAMEYIEGATLRQRLREGTLKIDEAINIAQQVATALTAAHKAGVVHRDIKPENIMIRPDGYVKVLDFGLAKLTERYGLPMDSQAATFPIFDTHSDHLLGTVNYLSPEQARRHPVDERTDVWSLGVVLYEMLVGRMPFTGETPSHAIVAILESEPESLTKSLDNVPGTLERIVRKALKKDRAERYRAVSDLAADLETLKQELSSGSFEAAKPERKGISSRYAIAAAVVLLIVVASGVIVSLTRRKEPEPALTTINSVAVLPFVNVSNDPNVDYLSDGMTDSLINRLSQLPNLKVIGRNSAFRYRDNQTDRQTIARELGVQAILTGRLEEHEGQISISVDLEDGRDKRHIWSEKYNLRPDEIPTIQNQIAETVTEKLRLRVDGENQGRLAKRYTYNTEAYQYYLRGRWLWNQRTSQATKQAATYFLKAIELDPKFALAYAGLADNYMLETSVSPRDAYLRGKGAVAKALELDSSLGEAHATLGFIKSHYERDWAGAEAEFKRAIELNPSYATAHHWYAAELVARRQFDQALQELRRAQELEPLSPMISVATEDIYYYKGQYDLAVEGLQRMIRLFPDFFPGHLNLGEVYTEKKMYAEALAQYAQAAKLSKRHPVVVSFIGYTHALSGNKREAMKALRELEARKGAEYVSPIRFATIYAGLGDGDRTFDLLNSACDQQDIGAIYINVNPVFKSLRSDQRFSLILRKLNLAQ